MHNSKQRQKICYINPFDLLLNLFLASMTPATGIGGLGTKINLYLIAVKVVDEGNGEMPADEKDPKKLDVCPSKRLCAALM